MFCLKMYQHMSLRVPESMYLYSYYANFSPNPIIDILLESSHQDDSNKWSNVGFGEEIMQVESTEVNFMHIIWSPTSNG